MSKQGGAQCVLQFKYFHQISVAYYLQNVFGFRCEKFRYYLVAQDEKRSIAPFTLIFLHGFIHA